MPFLGQMTITRCSETCIRRRRAPSRRSRTTLKQLGDNESLRVQAIMGVKQAALFLESQVKTLEKEVEQLGSTVLLLKEQSRRTEDIRKRAALLPMAQQEAAEAREEMEEWKERVRNMGKNITILRLEVVEWEDKEMARRKREKAEEEMSRKAAEGDQDEVVWVCPWMDAEHRSKCSVLGELSGEITRALL
ncbi:hypothetical protein BU17DRAFT_102999 [Hysterangium stoloniferum]|nr:hypothetical protein BU17DRAFT_102999 [Hysterangium stoloniferum]